MKAPTMDSIEKALAKNIRKNKEALLAEKGHRKLRLSYMLAMRTICETILSVDGKPLETEFIAHTILMLQYLVNEIEKKTKTKKKGK
jgi:hypothetical protein